MKRYMIFICLIVMLLIPLTVIGIDYNTENSMGVSSAMGQSDMNQLSSFNAMEQDVAFFDNGFLGKDIDTEPQLLPPDPGEPMKTPVGTLPTALFVVLLVGFVAMKYRKEARK